MSLYDSFARFMRDMPGDILPEEPLKNHCSFRIGGPAEVLFVPRSEKALLEALRFCRENGVKQTVLGNGTNVLVRDSGIRGVVIRLYGGLNDLIYLGDSTIAAGAGAGLTKVCLLARERSLTGLEFAYGIPGSVGGAVFMNAGAYGGEIKDALLSVRSVSPEDGGVSETPAAECELSYRSSVFMKNGRIVTAAYFRLTPGDPAAIEEKMTELLGRRRASQPLELPSAGSTFKRPKVGYAAALIDRCGLKGRRVGGAAVSEKHAGFVVNDAGATFADVSALMDEIRNTVYRETGVMLEPEVEILGE